VSIVAILVYYCLLIEVVICRLISVRILFEFLEVMFESLYCSVLTKTYTASVIINAGVFCSLVLMRRRCFDETECELSHKLHCCTTMHVMC